MQINAWNRWNSILWHPPMLCWMSLLFSHPSNVTHLRSSTTPLFPHLFDFFVLTSLGSGGGDGIFLGLYTTRSWWSLDLHTWQYHRLIERASSSRIPIQSPWNHSLQRSHPVSRNEGSSWRGTVTPFKCRPEGYYPFGNGQTCIILPSHIVKMLCYASQTLQTFPALTYHKTIDVRFSADAIFQLPTHEVGFRSFPLRSTRFLGVRIALSSLHGGFNARTEDVHSKNKRIYSLWDAFNQLTQYI